MADPVQHDPAARRFHASIEGVVAHLDYVMRDAKTMDTTHTWTPPAARGQGIAGRLVQAALEHARGQGWRVVPSCWYVAGWIDRHPEYEDLLA